MANLKNLTDYELDVAALVAAKNERLALVDVLAHLAEVDRRKSFSPRFESLVAYAIGLLGYDSKSAWRRVSALRLMQELPEITPAIESGKLDLTKIVLAQNHFRNEAKAALTGHGSEVTPMLFPPDAVKANTALIKAPLTKAEKIDVLSSMMSRSSREAERDLVLKSSAPEKLKRPDVVKPLAGQSNEVRLVLMDDDLALVRELKGLLAHRIPNASVGEVVSSALKAAVSAIKKERSGESKIRRAAREPVRSEESRRSPGAELKRKVWVRAQGKCEICESRLALEYDHRVPFASGGKTTFGNLRLLCRICNQRESIKIYGPRTFRNVRLELAGSSNFNTDLQFNGREKAGPARQFDSVRLKS
jgi:5-methylcytosine-specific restriction endonuclease McrA